MLRFGTDGVRGDADADLTTPLIVALGRAMIRKLRIYAGPTHPHQAQQPQPRQLASKR